MLKNFDVKVSPEFFGHHATEDGCRRECCRIVWRSLKQTTTAKKSRRKLLHRMTGAMKAYDY